MAAVAAERGAPGGLPASPGAQRLRVGVLAARLQPRWAAQAIARLAGAPFVALVGVHLVSPPPSRRPWSLSLYERLDRAVFGSDGHEPVDLGTDAAGLGTDSAGAGFRQVLKHSMAESVPSDLDVLLVLGEVEPPPQARPRFGVWRFAFDGLRDVAGGEPLAAAALVAEVPGEPARVVYRSWGSTYPLSVARHRAALAAKAAEFPFRALRELALHGPGWLADCPEASLAPPAGTKHGWHTVARIGARILRRGLEKAAAIEQWSLAFRLGGGEVPPDLAGFTRIAAPRDRDWADPFVLQRGGRWHVFFEALPHAEGKAHIAALEIDARGAVSKPVRVLERDYHLSYPFLLEESGALYMVPESARHGTVELYRCVDFPARWRLERVLLEGVRLVDATLHRAEGRWWMFANAAASGARGFDDELHLFHAERLAGPWRPHPANPVRSDARCARPAGKLFRRRGALYRPAQVCVPRYGAGLAIHRVMRLTPCDYAERQVATIVPEARSGLLGLHTLNRAGPLTVVDTFARIPRAGRLG